MKELTPHEPEDFGPARDQTVPPHARVLVVDDDETERRLTIRQLGKAWPVEGKLMVECAADGEEALEKIRHHRYILAVLDWNMPKKDGGAVLQTMRENSWNIPVVVVSGQRREAIARDLQAMPATFVNKNELNHVNFREAIATSMQLQECRRGVGSGLETR